MHQRNQLQCTAPLSKMDKRGVVMSLTPLMSIFLMNRLNHISHSHKTFRARVWYLNSKPSNQNAIGYDVAILERLLNALISYKLILAEKNKKGKSLFLFLSPSLPARGF
jgi:hypothetical protein